jgi:hypothetical protein
MSTEIGKPALNYRKNREPTMQSIANLEQSILENLRQLPPEKQQEVLDFAEVQQIDCAIIPRL